MTALRILAICLCIPLALAAGSLAYSHLRPLAITAETELDATPAEVWAVLADNSAYSAWHPSIIDSSGTIAVGQRLHNTVIFGDETMTFRPKVLAAEPERELTWIGHTWMPGLADGRHSFHLEPLPDGGTRLTQTEVFAGAAVPWAAGMLSEMEAESGAVNTAVDARAAALRTEGALEAGDG